MELVQRAVKEWTHALVDLGGRNNLLRYRDLKQGTLDLTQGEVAANLDRFYSILRANLLQVQLTKSAALLSEQISHLLPLREAWAEVERSAIQEEVMDRTSSFTAPQGLDSVADWSG